MCGGPASDCSLQHCIDSCTEDYSSTTNVEYHCDNPDDCWCYCQSGCECMEDVGDSSTWAPVGTLALPEACPDGGCSESDGCAGCTLDGDGNAVAGDADCQWGGAECRLKDDSNHCARSDDEPSLAALQFNITQIPPERWCRRRTCATS